MSRTNGTATDRALYEDEATSYRLELEGVLSQADGLAELIDVPVKILNYLEALCNDPPEPRRRYSVGEVGRDVIEDF